MKPKDASQFSWPELFLVTAACFLAFGGLIRLINGSTSHSGLFIKIGIVSLVLSALTYAAVPNARPEEKKKGRRSASYDGTAN